MVYPQKAGIYETVEDFLTDSVKFAGNYNEARNKIKLGYQHQQYLGTVNFGDTYYKYEDAPFFGYKDDCGNRYRIVNGAAYVVLAAGAIWMYSQEYRNGIYTTEARADDFIKRKKEGKKIQKYAAEQYVTIWYAVGLNGERIALKNWKKAPSEKLANTLFAKDAGIARQFLEDTKEDYSLLFQDSYMNNLERIIYYVELYNRQNNR